MVKGESLITPLASHTNGWFEAVSLRGGLARLFASPTHFRECGAPGLMLSDFRPLRKSHWEPRAVFKKARTLAESLKLPVNPAASTGRAPRTKADGFGCDCESVAPWFLLKGKQRSAADHQTATSTSNPSQQTEVSQRRRFAPPSFHSAPNQVSPLCVPEEERGQKRKRELDEEGEEDEDDWESSWS